MCEPPVLPQVPFTFSVPVPGQLRWATTYIARFDPDVAWPTDLDFNLIWNTNLTTYDGKRTRP
jgi:hypothetical protein